jgi:RNA polymerase sigma-70 factor (ECF subfamily)
VRDPAQLEQVESLDMSEQTFGKLYTYAYPLVYRYIARRIRHDVDDIAIEVFATAWRRKDKLPDSRDDQMLWLYGVARRKVANAIRLSKRKSKFISGLRSTEPDSTGTDTKAVASMLVHSSLSRMKPKEREVLLLVEWDGLSLGEAARILKVSESVTSRRLAAARASFIKLCEMSNPSQNSVSRSRRRVTVPMQQPVD